ncbi:MAG TPA: SH3 domain-containing protein [Candidatus Baltobacteraceae bacterium]|nr:SH3 domain-containing protein [Candidatus Baltobacteraceae bacterium]
MIRKLLIGFALVLVIGFAAYRHFHHAKPQLETAYVGSRQVTLYSTTAQVREAVATLSFGERVDVLSHFEDQVQVRTASGITGWTSGDQLLSADFWRQAQELEAETAKLPIQAYGHTRVLTNLHIDPARDAARIRQLDKNIPVDLYERRAVDVPSPSGASGPEDAGPPAEARKEDWWLVRARVPMPSKEELTLSGWLLGRFVDLNVPEPLPDYASAAGMRIVAWYELNHVVDSSGAAKPQYLVLGTRGSEGQPCDFTLIRVFTWGRQRDRYETAYVESDVCGKLPLKLIAGTAPGGDATFSFEDWSTGKVDVRTYHMHQTMVRLERANGAEPEKRKHKHG